MKKLLCVLSLILSFQVLADKVTMTCPSISCMSCQGKITKTLSDFEGIDKKSVAVDLDKKTVTFDYKLAANSKNADVEKTKFEEKLTEEMKKLGYPVVGDLVWDSATIKK